MSTGHKLLLAMAAVAVTAGCSSTSSGPASTSAPAPTRTVTKVATPSTPTSSSAPTSGGSGVGRVVGSAGTSLVAPAQPTRTTLTKDEEHCYGLLDPGFDERSCEKFHSKLGTAIAEVEYQGHQERDLVWTVTGSHARLALRRIRQASESSDTGTGVEVTDLMSDHTLKAVFLVPAASPEYGDNSVDDVDVVEASGQVVLHVDLHGGVARKAFGGGLETFTSAGAGYAHRTIYRFKDNAWRVVLDKRVNSDSIPEDTFSE